MESSITRFSNRLSLPKHLDFKLKSIVGNYNKQVIQNFNNKCKNKQILELYHSSRKSEAINEIMEKGFVITNSRGGNKGVGIYLANHSRYSMWAGNPFHVFICHVIADNNFVKRYKSEINSTKCIVPKWDSEFVVSEPELILPKYLLMFDIEKNINCSEDSRWDDFRYVNKDEWNCDNLECKRKWRCDCEQHPLVQKDDLVNIDY